MKINPFINDGTQLNGISIYAVVQSSVSELQRTRSGRISRPPQHRVKDYKLLRTVKYDTDHDNNLGYDDYDSPQLDPGVINTNFRGDTQLADS